MSVRELKRLIVSGVLIFGCVFCHAAVMAANPLVAEDVKPLLVIP